MILFDFHATSVKSFNRKRRHIGIIRIIYYPINGYPDSKLSVLSIPIQNYKAIVALPYLFAVVHIATECYKVPCISLLMQLHALQGTVATQQYGCIYHYNCINYIDSRLCRDC